MINSLLDKLKPMEAICRLIGRYWYILLGIIAAAIIFTGCESEEKNKKEFNLENHLKSNEWCQFVEKKKQCITFSNGKIIVKENDMNIASLNVKFNQKNDSLVIVKITGEQGFDSHFRMKSLDTLYYSEGDEDRMFKVFIRIE